MDAPDRSASGTDRELLERQNALVAALRELKAVGTIWHFDQLNVPVWLASFSFSRD